MRGFLEVAKARAEWLVDRPASPIYCVGVDPGTYGTSVALVRGGMDGTRIEAVLHVMGEGPKDQIPLLLGLRRAFSLVASLTMSAGHISLVEDQVIRQHGVSRTKRPENLLPLAQVAGAAMAGLVCRKEDPRAAYVTPQAWKGTQSKLVNHTKSLRTLGLQGTARGGKTPYMVPACTTECDAIRLDVEGRQLDMRSSDWKDGMDAVGIALFALETTQKQVRKLRILRRAKK